MQMVRMADRPGRDRRRARADHGRERDGQGAGRPRRPSEQRPGGRAVRGSPPRGAAREPGRARAVRAREGGVHRGRVVEAGAARPCLGRDDLLRRGGRGPAGDPDQAAPRARFGGVSGRRRRGRAPPEGPGHRRDQSRPRRVGPDRGLPRRPLLSPGRPADPPARAPRPSRGHPPALGVLPRPGLPRVGPPARAGFAAGPRPARPRLAGERPRAAERRRSGGPGQPGDRDPPRAPAGERPRRTGRAPRSASDELDALIARWTLARLAEPEGPISTAGSSRPSRPPCSAPGWSGPAAIRPDWPGGSGSTGRPSARSSASTASTGPGRSETPDRPGQSPSTIGQAIDVHAQGPRARRTRQPPHPNDLRIAARCGLGIA